LIDVASAVDPVVSVSGLQPSNKVAMAAITTIRISDLESDGRFDESMPES
jgi:hypothetical protein